MNLCKTILFIAIHVMTSNAFADGASVGFSAFSKGDDLVVTILADKCNSMTASLVVEGLCHEDRMTKNYALECGAKLVVFSSRMGCQDPELKPRVLTLSLQKNKVARESRVLHLEYDSQVIDVPLEQR